jgi:hypothetical protein
MVKRSHSPRESLKKKTVGKVDRTPSLSQYLPIIHVVLSIDLGFLYGLHIIQLNVNRCLPSD